MVKNADLWPLSKCNTGSLPLPCILPFYNYHLLRKFRWLYSFATYCIKIQTSAPYTVIFSFMRWKTTFDVCCLVYNIEIFCIYISHIYLSDNMVRSLQSLAGAGAYCGRCGGLTTGRTASSFCRVNAAFYLSFMFCCVWSC